MEHFTAKDISVIIKACKDSGVSSLDCGGLKLSFHAEESAAEPEPIQGQFFNGGSDEVDHKKLSEMRADENQELQDLELQNLMISDPVAFEQHMRHDEGEQYERPQ